MNKTLFGFVVGWLSLTCLWANPDSIRVYSWENIQLETVEDVLELESHRDEVYDLEEQYQNKFEDKLYLAAKKFGVDTIVPKVAYSISTRYYNIDSTKLAVEFLDEALSYRNLLEKQNPILLGAIQNLQGIFYREGGQWENAMESFFASMETFDRINSNFRAYPLGNISDLYERMGELEKAISINLKSLEVSHNLEGVEHFYHLGFDTYRLSKWYLTLNKQDSAKYYLDKSLEVVKSLESNSDRIKELQFYIFENATHYFLNTKEFNKAKDYLNKAEQKVINRLRTKLMLLKGNFYLANNNRQQALSIANLPSNLFKDFDVKREHLQFKIKIFEQFDMLEEANATYRALNQFNQENIGNDHVKHAKFFNAIHEVKLKQLEINFLKKQQAAISSQNESRKAWLITSFTLVTCLLLGMVFASYLIWQKSQFNQTLKVEVERKTKDLTALNQRLEYQYEELQRFNHVVSHDLKEPIRSIVSFSNILQKKIEDKDNQEYLDYVVNAGKQLYYLIDDIKDFQNVEQIKYEWSSISLGTMVESVKNALQLFIKERGAEVVTHDLPNVVTVKSALFIVLKNLIENGIKYNDSLHPKVEISYLEEEGYYLIHCTDNGIGIHENYFDEVFVLFARLNNRSDYEGSGIGLAISQKIANKIGGEISIFQSEIGKGTTFQLRLPKYKQNGTLEESQSREKTLVNSHLTHSE